MIAAILTWLSGSVLERLLAHARQRLDGKTEQDRIAAELAAEEIRAEIAARSEARKVLLAENGQFFSAGRLGRLVFVLPLGLWWAAVCLDSVFRFGWKIAEVPVLRDWGGAIITSLFLVDGVKSISRSIRPK
ncbi:hypothetical protein [Roseibium polysiphoniae]|uniref:Holin (3TMs family) n=1 Tax=Roseibium polysiphoniae TaxID=2571221 RepID=A0ABR9C4U2_9HYPH|nr:hypothetical protein [Roseibium polysiphoniae]MBD8874869.1 hypothetical protein [Roseibium polysiphoniae]